MKEEEKQIKRGANQWSEIKFNFIKGCPHCCKYCYSRCISIRKGYSTPTDWKDEVIRERDFNKKIPKYKGIVMFPSSHDITPIHLNESIQILDKLLRSDNMLVIVSKPHMECILKICETFSGYKDKIIFRFSIGSTDSQILKFWEPNAPSFEERFNCLKLAHSLGFQTSVSGEPLLQRDIDNLFDTLSPYVNETFWIGKANHLLYRLKMNGYGDPNTIEKANELMAWQNDPAFIRYLFEKYFNNPMIRFKESYLEEFEKRGWI